MIVIYAQIDLIFHILLKYVYKDMNTTLNQTQTYFEIELYYLRINNDTLLELETVQKWQMHQLLLFYICNENGNFLIVLIECPIYNGIENRNILIIIVIL